MNQPIKYFVILLLAATACQSPKEKALKNIKALESNDSAFSNELMRQLKTAYLDFTTAYPDDENTPEYLFKAAQRCIVLQESKEAVSLLSKICEQYPKSTYSEDALFLQAYTYENNLNDTATARVHYNDFIKKYPKGELAEDAKLALVNLGKSAEDIIGEIEE